MWEDRKARRHEHADRQTKDCQQKWRRGLPDTHAHPAIEENGGGNVTDASTSLDFNMNGGAGGGHVLAAACRGASQKRLKMIST